MLWEELLEVVITSIYSLLHTLLKDKYMGLRDENCKSLVLQDKCNIEIFLSPACIYSGFTTEHKNQDLLYTHNFMKHSVTFQFD